MMKEKFDKIEPYFLKFAVLKKPKKAYLAKKAYLWDYLDPQKSL